ncbi:hypothetical protein F0U44_13125 [Nocardioides humilatus]|uniref:Ig-like domain repeat protein n=1 Tax=Nocardioides humilatus TaxID=2607660 RepID=A0A5B1LGA0_9ACTN|nr:hypothetical protein [Nocardioides humilatus]KAA1419374.1 hypothetical protein F0U44_13125 [Nocardioides humilatus]
MKFRAHRALIAFLATILGLVAWMAPTRPAGAADPPADPDVVTACTSQYVVPGQVLSCSVTVQNGAPYFNSTVFIEFTPSKGTVSPTACSGTSYCSFSYTPSGAGSSSRKDTLVVNYSGDANHAPSTNPFVLHVVKEIPAPITYSCGTPTIEGRSVACTAALSDPNAVGTVTFSASTRKGTLSTTSCGINSVIHTCATTYTPLGKGTKGRKDKVTASYTGDPWYADAKLKAVVKVDPKPVPAGGFSCSPNPAVPGQYVTCEVGVTGDPSPTGFITPSVSSNKGTVTPATCNVEDYFYCVFYYQASGTGTNTRADKVTFSYTGDANWAPTEIVASIGVRSP